jgi:hypothetical protein
MPAKKEIDRLQLEHFAKSESAVNTISTIMGFTVTDLITERHKPNLNKQKIEELEKALDIISDERQAIYGGDENIMQLAEERYVPIIRERLENA